MMLAMTLIAPAFASAENSISVNLDTRGGQMRERMEERRADIDNAIKAKANIRANMGMGNVCERIVDADVKFEALTKMWGSNAAARATFKDERQANREAYWNGTIKDTRGDWDEKRQSGYDKMLAAADTDAEREAVAEFKADVEEAITAKRVAIDAWIAANKTARDSWESTHRTAIEAAYKDFATAIRTAITKAKDACADDNADTASIAAAFKADIDAARVELKADLKVAAEKDWITDKRSDLKEIMDDFHTAIKDAKAKLEASFDVKTEE